MTAPKSARIYNGTMIKYKESDGQVAFCVKIGSEDYEKIYEKAKNERKPFYQVFNEIIHNAAANL